jgi:hypothetical protein
MEARLRTDATAGIIFDRYDEDDFKFVAIDVSGDRVIFGHMDPKRGLQIDQSTARSFDPGVEYALKLVFKGASVSATVNGALAGSWGYNAAVVDGQVGVLSKDGAASFSSVRIRTNDPAFDGPAGMTAAGGVGEGATGTVTQGNLDAIAEVAISQWAEALGADDPRLAALQGVHIGFADLDGAQLGQADGDSIVLDTDAAGYGWFVDFTPEESGEFRLRVEGGVAAAPGSEAYGRMDLLTVVTHELGHVMGLDHINAGALPVMLEDLRPGARYLLGSAEVAAAPQEATTARLEEPVAELIGAPAAVVKVDWQTPLNEAWSQPLSFYEPVKVKKGAAGNFADFGPVKPQGQFDAMGRELLGKGKTK